MEEQIQEWPPYLLLHTLVGGFEGRLCSGSLRMDAALWRKLPEGVLDRVLLLLPPLSKFRFRCVSKRWRTLLSSPDVLLAKTGSRLGGSFPHICAVEVRWPIHHPQHPLLQREQQVVEMASSSGRNVVHHMDLSFLPTKFGSSSGRRPYVKSHDGLVCVVAGSPNEAFLHEVAICVLNPMNRTWRELPQITLADGMLPQGRGWLLHLVAGRAGAGDKATFKVVFVSDWDSVHRVSTAGVFSSDHNSWSVTTIAWVHRRPGDIPNISFCDEVLYSLGAGERLTLYSIDGNRVTLQSASHPSATAPLQNLRLVKHGQDLYAVVLSFCVWEFSQMSCAIWKLEQQGMGWDKVAILLNEGERLYEIEISVGARGHDTCAVLNSVSVVDDHICVFFIIRRTLSDDLREPPKLICFRILDPLQVALDIDEAVVASLRDVPIQLFTPRCDLFV